MNKRNSPYKTFEIKVGYNEDVEVSNVNRITFQEAVRDAYMMIAASNFTKNIISVRVLDEVGS